MTTSAPAEADVPTQDTGHPSSTRRLRLRREWRMPLVVALWAQVVLLLWWAAQFPGLLSFDSTVYVTHVTVGPWTADHSVLYDFFVLVSLHLTRSVWLLTLLQTTVWSAVLAYAACSIRVWGVRGRWAAIPATILPLVPGFGGFVSTVWKDVGFTLCEVLLMATLLRLIKVWTVPQRRVRRRRSRQRTDAADAPDDVGDASAPVASPSVASPTPWRLLTAVGFEYVGLILFRADGFVMITVMTVVLVIVMRGLRVKLLVAGVASIIAMFIANDVVYPAAGIKAASASLSYGTFYADISVVYSEAPGTFTTADKELMSRVAPLRVWRKGGNCYSSDKLNRQDAWGYGAANRNRHELAKLWLRILARTPVATIKSRLCRSAIAWNPFPPPTSRAATPILPAGVPADLYGRTSLLPKYAVRNLQPDPLNADLYRAAHWLKKDLADPAWLVLIWRGATWCYLAYLALLIGLRRVRNWRLLAVGVVLLGNQVMVMVANPSQLYRYMVGPIIVGMLLIPLAAAARVPSTATATAPPTPDEPTEPAVAQVS